MISHIVESKFMRILKGFTKKTKSLTTVIKKKFIDLNKIIF